MDLDNKTICYFFVYNKTSIPGVHNKILGTLESAKRKGYNVRQYSCENFERPSFLKMLFEIVRCKEKYLIVRSIFYLNFLMFPFIFIARLQGKIIYCDVPSSFKSAYFEIIDFNCSILTKCKYLIGLFIGASWSLFPYNFILIYSEDYLFFTFFLHKKIIFMTNSISKDQVIPRQKKPEWPSNELNLIGVAFVSNYHGYDRILQFISEWNILNKFKINFTIVGDGPALKDLKNYTDILNISDFISFKGTLSLNQIYPLYENSHIAIGSIGLHRKKMMYHSELKSREYTAIGIPFISTGIDLDFSNEEKFRIIISSDDSIDELFKLFNNIDDILLNINVDYISNYAKTKLTFDNKLSKYKLYE